MKYTFSVSIKPLVTTKAKLFQKTRTYRKSRQGLVEANVLHDQQIGSFSLEELVILLLDDEIDVARLSSWDFVGQSLECDLLVVMSALFDVDFNDFSLVLRLCLVSLPVTFTAWALHLGNHSWPNLSHFHDHSVAVASRTLARGSHKDLSVDS